jgi:hypothetical protein
MLIAAGGSISGLFNEVVMGRNELLLDVDNLIYEDKLGLSGWIRDRRVFLGNRKLIENHDISIPLGFDESQYRKDKRRVLYLADNGKVTAIFVVSYGTDKRIGEYLRRIEENGITIVVRTTDSNITEDFVAKAYGLPVNTVRVVGSNVTKVLEHLSETPTEKEDAQVIHNGSALAYLRSICAAYSLSELANFINVLTVVGMTVGMVLLFVFALVSNGINPFAALLYQLIWTAFSIAVPTIAKDQR